MKSGRPEPKENELVHFHGPKVTEGHAGHGATTFEGTDARASIVIWSLAIIGGTLVIVFAITIGVQRFLQANNPPGSLPSPIAPARVIPPAPQLQVHPWEELPDLRAHEDEVLNGYGKDANGHWHIPIAKAMDSVVSQLDIRPGAGEGITTPGGQGRDFAGSLGSMPAPYQSQRQGPQIQGEIHKHAQ
jgi:hypothetical protein